ncbi:hypothetical protein Tco_1193791 [Tanacetum coccineum]
MIACVAKTERNADFHEWIQQFWSTAKVRMLNEVAHIEAKVAGKKILVSEATVRTDLMFNDEDGTNCFDNQVIWDTLRDIGYEGSLTLLSFSKPLFSPQWKYLVHTLLHCLSSKSSSWDQFGTNIASALVGLATNQKFNFSKLIFDGMLRNLKDSKPFLMYPRFIQLFLNKQLEGIPKPQNFLPTVVLPSKVFTFMSKCSPKFSGKLTPLTPHMLKVATAVRDEHSLPTEELDIYTSSQHSDDPSAGEKAKSPSPVASERTASPNDYTPTNEESKESTICIDSTAKLVLLRGTIGLIEQLENMLADSLSTNSFLAEARYILSFVILIRMEKVLIGMFDLASANAHLHELHSWRPLPNDFSGISHLRRGKRKKAKKEIYDLSESDDDLPKDGIFDGNSFDDENKDSEEEIDLDLTI